jgi:membrane protein
VALTDRISALPYVGPVWRAYSRYNDKHGNRLAAAATYYGFLSLFPLLTLAAALIAGLLDRSKVQELKDKISEQIPGVADKLDLDALVDNAGTVGVVGGVLLLVSGTGWIDAVRSAIRAIWGEDEAPGNMITGKLADIGVLIGLGVTMGLSVAASGFATAVTGQLSNTLGLADNPVGRVLLQIAAFAIAVGASLLLFLYLLVGVPRLQGRMSKRVAVRGALIGAVGFEILKLLVSSYIAGVAGKSMYGAFGVPIALLLWIYFVNRLMLFCAAWTATAQTARDTTVRYISVVEDPGPGRRIPDRSAPPARSVRPYLAGILGTAGAGVALERFTRHRTGSRN